MSVGAGCHYEQHLIDSLSLVYVHSNQIVSISAAAVFARSHKTMETNAVSGFPFHLTKPSTCAIMHTWTTTRSSTHPPNQNKRTSKTSKPCQQPHKQTSKEARQTKRKSNKTTQSNNHRELLNRNPTTRKYTQHNTNNHTNNRTNTQEGTAASVPSRTMSHKLLQNEFQHAMRKVRSARTWTAWTWRRCRSSGTPLYLSLMRSSMWWILSDQVLHASR